MIYYESISSPIGDLFFGIKEQGICSLSFLGKEKIAEKNIPSSKQIKLFQLLKQELQEYFLKKREKFTVPLLLDGTIFQKNSWEQLQKIRKVFHINLKIKQFWKHGETEVSMFWDDVELGLDCKARMDWYDADSMKIVDLKFTKSIGKLCNDKLMDQHFSVQAAWYRRGVYQLTGDACDFLFIFIEKYSPHIIRVIKANEEIIRHGEQTILSAIKRCNNKT